MDWSKWEKIWVNISRIASSAGDALKHLSKEASVAGTKAQQRNDSATHNLGEVAEGDSRSGHNVLESRGLKETYGSGEKRPAVLARCEA